MAVEREVLIERNTSFDGMKISWGGVFGGVLAGVGTLMLLSSLGLAIGISAVDPRDPNGQALGTGAAIWTALSLLIALFLAGWASTRLSMLWERTTAMFEGVLVWVLSLILILYLAASGVGLIASGAFSLLGNTAQAVGSSVGGAMDMESMSAGDVDQMLARLRDPSTVQMVASATGMPEQEVRGQLDQLSGRVEQARNDPARAADEVRRTMSELGNRAAQNVQRTAVQAKPAATRTAWIAFGAMVLSLLAAIWGAAVGRRGVVKKTVPDRP